MRQNGREHISMQNPLRQEYIEYAATFDRMLETGAIAEENGKFYEKTQTGTVPVIKLTYTRLLGLYISRHKYRLPGYCSMLVLQENEIISRLNYFNTPKQSEPARCARTLIGVTFSQQPPVCEEQLAVARFVDATEVIPKKTLLRMWDLTL